MRAKFFAERHLKTTFAHPFIGLIVVDRPQIVGAIILNDYTPERNIEVTGVGRGWSVGVVRFILRYCFARVRRITARTSINNHAAITALEQIGFKREGVMREFFDDGDAIVFGLLRSEQKLIRV